MLLETRLSLEGRSIALVEDDPIMGESLVQRLSIEGATVKWWQDGAEALRNLRKSEPEIVVCDIRLPDMTGEEMFHHLADERDCAPFLFITAYGDIDQAVRLMRAGAGDFLTKPFQMDAFLDRVSSLIRVPKRPVGEPVLGLSSSMRRIEMTLRRIAASPATVLLTGETGTGKDIAARFLHAISPSRSKPFIAVNCAAIPHDLLESELFGHERGAFTGADKRHLGYPTDTAKRGHVAMVFGSPAGSQGNVVNPGVNELVLPNYKHTWGNIRKIADATARTKAISFKSKEYKAS